MVLVLAALRARRLWLRFLPGPRAGGSAGAPGRQGVAPGLDPAGHAQRGGAATGSGNLARPAATPGSGACAVMPKLIFQTWKSKTSLPDSYARWSQSLRAMNADFEYLLWDDDDNRRLIRDAYPWFLPVYDAYPREIYRVDAVRYFFLYQFGGLYADMDTECLRPIDCLSGSADVWLGRMGCDPDFAHSIPNAIMASRPRQEFWLLVIHVLLENARFLGDQTAMNGRGPESMTGPIALKRAYDTYTSGDRGAVREMIGAVADRLPEGMKPYGRESRVALLEPSAWYPIDWSNMIHLRLSSQVVDCGVTLPRLVKHCLFPRSCFISYWSHSWKQPSA